MTMRCQVLPHERADGPANMALDEALLDAAARDPAVVWFRTYGWTVPTLSLGYFQSVADRDADPRWRDVPFVRRPTGGGAIWHDLEVTYALAIPRGHPLARQSVALYHAVHSAIAGLLQEQGVGAVRRGLAAPENRAGRPFLCFTDRDPEDIVAGGVKIVGSAQRRRSGATLQHGSMLLVHSLHTPELPGAGDLAPVFTDERYWSPLLRDRVLRALGLVPEECPPGPIVRDRARVLEETVYRNPAWNWRR